MTATLNKVQLIGNIGAAPKSIKGQDGNHFVTASIAINEAVKQGDEWKSKVEWYQLVFFGSLVKVTEFLHKGSLVYVEGKLRTNQWIDKEGQSRQAISIIVGNLQLLGNAYNAEKGESSNAKEHLSQMRDMLTDGEETPF